MSLPSKREDFSYLSHLRVEKLLKMQMFLFSFWYKFITTRVEIRIGVSYECAHIMLEQIYPLWPMYVSVTIERLATSSALSQNSNHYCSLVPWILGFRETNCSDSVNQMYLLRKTVWMSDFVCIISVMFLRHQCAEIAFSFFMHWWVLCKYFYILCMNSPSLQ